MLIAFREWRRTRPFWGGLLIVCGAAEILSTTVLSLGPTFRVGLGGVNAFVGVIITAVLGLCGLLLWFSPGQRTFYSIVAVILALATFNTINYGGFFLGMLLGIVGGAMAFAWSSAPARNHPQKQSTPPPGSLVARMVRGWFWRQGQARQAKTQKGQTQKGQTQGAGAGSRDRLLTVTAPLAGLLLLAPAGQALRLGGTNRPAHTSGGCILIILCPPSKSPTPTPTPTTTSPAPSHRPSPTPRTAPPVTSQSPSTRPSTPGQRGRGKVKRTATPLGLMAPAVPATLTAGRARFGGLVYDGVTEVPRPSGGPLPMLKFTLRSVTLTGNPALIAHQNGSVVTTSASLLSFSGNVVLYVTRLSGELLGVRVTLTPRSPLPLVTQSLRPLTQGTTRTMTHLVTGQPIIMAAASHWDNFHTTVG